MTGLHGKQLRKERGGAPKNWNPWARSCLRTRNRGKRDDLGGQELRVVESSLHGDQGGEIGQRRNTQTRERWFNEKGQGGNERDGEGFEECLNTGDGRKGRPKP